jgi:hypothetical protein
VGFAQKASLCFPGSVLRWRSAQTFVPCIRKRRQGDFLATAASPSRGGSVDSQGFAALLCRIRRGPRAVRGRRRPTRPLGAAAHTAGGGTEGEDPATGRRTAPPARRTCAARGVRQGGGRAESAGSGADRVPRCPRRGCVSGADHRRPSSPRPREDARHGATGAGRRAERPWDSYTPSPHCTRDTRRVGGRAGPRAPQKPIARAGGTRAARRRAIALLRGRGRPPECAVEQGRHAPGGFGRDRGVLEGATALGTAAAGSCALSRLDRRRRGRRLARQRALSAGEEAANAERTKQRPRGEFAFPSKTCPPLWRHRKDQPRRQFTR